MSDLNQILNSLNDVPAMPNVIKHALDIMKDPESSARELAKVVSYDQSLSTRVLTLVNSAYYGFSQQITSIQRAIALIGMSKTKSVIVTVALKPMLSKQGGKELWQHSIKTAVGCEYIANSLKLMDADEAFVVGFLHDLGKIVLNIKDSSVYEKVTEMASSGSDIIEVERAFFGTDHQQMGSLLAKKWQLPLLVANVIKYHHEPNLSSMQAPCGLVYYVDKLVQPNWTPEMLNNETLKNLNIKIDKPEILRESILTKASALLQELSD